MLFFTIYPCAKSFFHVILLSAKVIYGNTNPFQAFAFFFAVFAFVRCHLPEIFRIKIQMRLVYGCLTAKQTFYGVIV